MKQTIVHVAIVVKDYDEAINFYTGKLGFELVEDTYIPVQNKRWVLVMPPNSDGAALLLAKAARPEQTEFIGNQARPRVPISEHGRFLAGLQPISSKWNKLCKKT